MFNSYDTLLTFLLFPFRILSIACIANVLLYHSHFLYYQPTIGLAGRRGTRMPIPGDDRSMQAQVHRRFRCVRGMRRENQEQARSRLRALAF